MGLRLCIEPGCLNPTISTRCKPCESAYQRARNNRRGASRPRRNGYRGVSLAGQVCACCGTIDDLTRHHVGSLQTGDWTGVIVAMCRRCNSSIGTKTMDGLTCPMHGGATKSSGTPGPATR